MVKRSVITAKAALKIAISSREEEEELKAKLKRKNIYAAAIDFGGKFDESIKDIIENAVIAARRENLIEETHVHQGAVAGAAHDAISQVLSRSSGLSVGGKIALVRNNEHIVVAVFFSVGMLNLNEIAVGLSHRSIN